MVSAVGNRPAYAQARPARTVAPQSVSQPVTYAPQSATVPVAPQQAGPSVLQAIGSFFAKLAEAFKNFLNTLLGKGTAPAQAQGLPPGAYVPTSSGVTPPPLVITPESQAAAQRALPDLDRLSQHLMMLKPALDLLKVRKPNPDEMLAFLVEAKLAMQAVAAGQQPQFRSTQSAAAFGKEALKFSTDAMGFVMMAKGMADLFKYNDPQFRSVLGEVERELMSLRMASDIIARNPQ